jgi:precorrin-8X/cobalt-precorrin-8 methylmutase
VAWPEELEGPDDAAIRAEEEGYRILRSSVDLSRLPRFSRDVTERVIFASADLGYATDLVCTEDALASAVAALAAGAPVVADAPMTAAGITGWPVICKANESLTLRLARTASISRAAAAARLAFGEAGPGAVWIVGGEPSAIYEILGRGTQPAFVIAMPAGFAGAVEAKRALRGSGIPALTNVSEKGGPVVAAAACHALLRRAVAQRLDPTGAGSG